MPESHKLSAQEPATKKAKTGASELEVGDQIPDLTLHDENGEEVHLPEIAKKTKYLVIFAYPKASTPGCTRQAKGFQKNHKSLAELNATVYGLSADSAKSQLNFVTKQGLEYSLLSDPNRELIEALGAKKSPSGIKRSHWIFKDGELVIKRIAVSPEVSVDSALEDIQRFNENNEDEEDEGEDADEDGDEDDETADVAADAKSGEVAGKAEDDEDDDEEDDDDFNQDDADEDDDEDDEDDDADFAEEAAVGESGDIVKVGEEEE